MYRCIFSCVVLCKRLVVSWNVLIRRCALLLSYLVLQLLLLLLVVWWLESHSGRLWKHVNGHIGSLFWPICISTGPFLSMSTFHSDGGDYAAFSVYAHTYCHCRRLLYILRWSALSVSAVVFDSFVSLLRFSITSVCTVFLLHFGPHIAAYKALPAFPAPPPSPAAIDAASFSFLASSTYLSRHFSQSSMNARHSSCFRSLLARHH